MRKGSVIIFANAGAGTTGSKPVTSDTRLKNMFSARAGAAEDHVDALLQGRTGGPLSEASDSHARSRARLSTALVLSSPLTESFVSGLHGKGAEQDGARERQRSRRGDMRD